MSVLTTISFCANHENYFITKKKVRVNFWSKCVQSTVFSCGERKIVINIFFLVSI